jgi:ferrochelatase
VSEAGASLGRRDAVAGPASAAPSEQSVPSEAGADAVTAISDSRSGGYDGILLAGFGGPEGPDDVLPFLRNVTRGRGVPDDRLAEVAEHYLALGGVSPINAQNRVLREALDSELRRRGVDLPVLWGNRNWAPYLPDAVADGHARGLRSLLGVATSAYSSYSSCRQYREDFGRALRETGLLGVVRIDKLRPYFDHPGFLVPFADGVVAAIDAAGGRGLAMSDLQVMFTTHSIPLSMADASGAPGEGRLYVEQHLAGCAAVDAMVRARLTSSPDWRLAYQSRSGPPEIPWLEPDVNDVIAAVAAAGKRGVVVVPIGFVSDHMEVIWDLDTEAARTAADHGLWFHRVPTPGTHPEFVSGLAELIIERLRGGPDSSDEPAPRTDRIGSATALPARPDRCPPDCCVPRTRRPTTAGADSAVDWAGTDVDPAALVASGIPGMVHR